MKIENKSKPKKLKVASLFSGIGGFERGLEKVGFETSILCEIDPLAKVVLKRQFPGVEISQDVRKLRKLPKVNLLTAGFPCQDLSQAGNKNGINGNKSSLVGEVFRILHENKTSVTDWVLLENVAYMLRLKKGEAIKQIIASFEELGYRWAYRLLDARAFGLPQRRKRIIFLASKKYDPAPVLFEGDEIPTQEKKPSDIDESSWYGFYWTEGSRGVGWTQEGTPPIKGGSGLGIPSPPAVWIPSKDFFGTIHIEDAERLQGFPVGWTEPIMDVKGAKIGARWKTVGNAVSVPMAEWVGKRLLKGGDEIKNFSEIHDSNLPIAAFGSKGKIFSVNVSTWPKVSKKILLRDFLIRPLKPLSRKATLGFTSRAKACTNVNYSPRFIESLQLHATKMA